MPEQSRSERKTQNRVIDLLGECYRSATIRHRGSSVTGERQDMGPDDDGFGQ